MTTRRRRPGAPAATATAGASPPALTSEATPFKATLFPNAADARADVHGFSLGLVADRSRRVRGLQLAIGWAQTDENLVGLQMAAGAILAQGHFEGVQMAAGATILRGTGRGVQMVGGGNIVEGSYVGLQMAGGINTISANMKGLQMAGGANWAGGDGVGLQMAGGINLAKNFTGLQIAPANYAETMTGMQLGVVNSTLRSVSGFRLGVVNTARESHGFSFGVVNVAKHDDGESFALINIIGNGIHDVSLFATDVMVTNVGFKLGGRHLYTNLIAGYQPGDELAAGPERFSAGSKRFGDRRRHRLALPRRARPARVRRARGRLAGGASGLELDRQRARHRVVARAGRVASRPLRRAAGRRRRQRRGRDGRARPRSRPRPAPVGPAQRRHHGAHLPGPAPRPANLILDRELDHPLRHPGALRT